MLHDPRGPVAGGKETGSVKLGTFNIPNLSPRMAIARGENRGETVSRAIEAIGGMGTYIKEGDIVLLKVNAAFASPPSLSATTHPDVVEEMVRLCLDAGAGEVRVTDNPINDPASCFKLSGIGEAATSAGARVILPKESYFKTMSLEGGSLIKKWPVLYAPFEGVNKVIGIAPLKDHHRSGASMTMKNWYGILGGRRNIFHQDIHNIIKELAMLVTPTLVILDGTTTMMTNGPTGGSFSDLKKTNTIIVSTDQVAADAYGVTLLGRTVSDLPFISKAEAEGVGPADYKSLEPVELT
jgi:uncharacterized protein (DUF362 family)